MVFVQTQICFPVLNDGFLYETVAAEDANNTKCHLHDICQQNLVISVCNRCLSLSLESAAKMTVYS